jgi:ADP-heptose:LPS heptosyltransferase
VTVNEFFFWRLRSLLGRLGRLLLPVRERPVRRILCIVCGGIGDRLLALPAIRFLCQKHPNAHLCVAWFEGESPQIAPEFDEELSFSRNEVLPKLRLALRGFDLCFVNTIGVYRIVADACAFLSRARVRIGPRAGGWGGVSIYNRPYEGGREHETVLQARAVGWSGAETMLPYTTPRPMQDRTPHSQQPETPSRLVAVHVGSAPGYEMKRWAASHYRELLAHLMSDTAVQIALLGSEQERELMNAIAPASSARVVVLSGVAEWVGHLTQCRLLVGNDSGPAHLAAALGIPVLVIMSPTDPARCQPVGACVRVVYRACRIGSCYYNPSPCLRCIDSIQPQDVASAVANVLAGRAGDVRRRQDPAILCDSRETC